MLKLTTRKVLRSWHANCIWATGIAPTEAMAAVQVAKCLSCSSNRMLAIKSSTGLEPPVFSLEYVQSLKYKGKTLLEYNIRTYVSVEQALKEQLAK